MDTTILPAELVIYVQIALPEITLACGAMALLLFAAFAGDRYSGVTSAMAVALLVLVGMVLTGQPAERQAAFSSGFVTDGFIRFMKMLSLAGAAIAIILAHRFMVAERTVRAEYPVLVLFATLGMLLLISANDLIALYLGLEMMSLTLYVLASIHRDDKRSSEAGMKYFVLGALSTGLLLYGSSLIYGFTGTTNFAAIAQVLGTGEPSIGVTIGIVFLLAGLAFKISAVPFHMWTPDVYEGAPTPVTAFFAMAPKVAAIALIVRVTVEPLAAVATEWRQIVVFLSIASMTLGAVAAIGQTNIKRLMAYSSIGHMGYALVGLAAGSQEGVQAVAVYMAIYLATTAGVFVVILSMRRATGMAESIEDLAGLSQTHPRMAFALWILLFSLAGIPPFAGFFAKWYVFWAAVEAGLVPLAIIGVLTSTVAAYYYLRVVATMYFQPAAPAFQQPMGLEMRVVLTASTAFVVLFIVLPGPLLVAAENAARALLP